MKLLDLFCKAGGAAVGYHRVGFEVVGVDHEPQPRYPFEFVQADALEYLKAHGHEFDAIHASPPCQRFSVGTRRWKGRSEQHPDLIEPCRSLLLATGKPYVVENVVGAPLVRPLRLCGTMFGLKVFRHRLFESSVPLAGMPHQKHDGGTGAHRGYSTARRGVNGFICVAGHNFEFRAGAEAMGIDWMANRAELSQAVPPAYTEFVGKQIMSFLLGENQ